LGNDGVPTAGNIEIAKANLWRTCVKIFSPDVLPTATIAMAVAATSSLLCMRWLRRCSFTGDVEKK